MCDHVKMHEGTCMNAHPNLCSLCDHRQCILASDKCFSDMQKHAEQVNVWPHSTQHSHTSGHSTESIHILILSWMSLAPLLARTCIVCEFVHTLHSTQGCRSEQITISDANSAERKIRFCPLRSDAHCKLNRIRGCEDHPQKDRKTASKMHVCYNYTYYRSPE